MKKLLALSFLFLASFANAQGQTCVDGSCFTAVRGWNGTSVFNVGDSVNNAIRVNVVAGAGGGSGTSSTFGAAFPATGTAIGYSDGTNMQGARVVDADTGAGTVYVQVNNLVRRASGGPTELIGQATMANSLPVTLASDQSNVTTQPATIASANNDGAQATLTTTSSTILASFATRRFAAICAAPTNTDTVFIKFGATATTADFLMPAGMCWNALPGTVYSGVIDGRSNTGSQLVTFVEW